MTLTAICYKALMVMFFMALTNKVFYGADGNIFYGFDGVDGNVLVVLTALTSMVFTVWALTAMVLMAIVLMALTALELSRILLFLQTTRKRRFTIGYLLGYPESTLLC